MAWLEYLGLALLLFALVSVALLSLRLRDALVIWAWGWIGLLLTGTLYAGFEGPAWRVAAAIFAEGHPLLMLVGALAFLRRPLPNWVVPIAVGAGAVRASFEAGGMGGWGHAFTWPLEFAAFVYAGTLLWRHCEPQLKLIQRTVAGGLFAMACVETVDVSFDLIYGPTVWWIPWIVAGVVTAGGQIVLYLETQSARTSRSEANLVESDRAAAEARERFEALAQYSHDVIAELNDDGTIRYVSPNVQTVLGMAPAQMIGHTLIEMMVRVGAEPGGPSPFPDLRLPLSEVKQRGPYNRLVRLPATRGTRWLEIEAHTFTASTGEGRTIALARDVTARMEFEGQLRSLQKLESLGVLAGGVAHDFNNLLMGVLGNAELARADVGSDDRAGLQRHLQGIIDAAHQAAGLTAQLLTYAGKGPRNTTPLSLLEVVSQGRDLILTAAHSRAEVVFDLDPDTPHVLGDRSQLAQIVLNLVSNAAEACDRGQHTITIRTRALSADEPPPSDLGRSLARGDYALLEVADDGAGMTEDVRQRIFDPFFTTKLTGRGLGLAAVQGMVLAHGGGLTVDSVPGRGSTFRVLLPVTQPTAPQSKVTSQSTWTRSGLVLLVDDTPTALETVQRILNRAGLEVLTAHSGADARELIAVRAAGLALAVLDFALPDDNAVDLLRMIDQHRPGLPVIIMSGYSREEVATELAGQPYAAFLQKPFGADDILAVLDDLAGSRLAT